MSEIDQMKLDMVTKLASLLMEEQPELTMEQALFITKVHDMSSLSCKQSCKQVKLVNPSSPLLGR